MKTFAVISTSILAIAFASIAVAEEYELSKSEIECAATKGAAIAAYHYADELGWDIEQANNRPVLKVDLAKHRSMLESRIPDYETSSQRAQLKAKYREIASQVFETESGLSEVVVEAHLCELPTE